MAQLLLLLPLWLFRLLLQLTLLLRLVFFLAMTISSLVILTSSPHLKLDLDME